MKASLESQSRLSGQISRTIENLRKLGKDKITRGVLEARIDNLQEKWNMFRTEHESLEKAATAEDRKLVYFQEDFFTVTEEHFLDQKAKLLDLLRNFTTKAPEAPRADPLSLARQSLPKINIPKFSGEYTEWLSFRDLFKSLVIDTALTPIEQMHYLKTNLTKEAASLIASVPATGENFTVAWDLLSSRYDNVRLLTSAQISNLFSLPAMKSEASLELKVLFNGTCNAIGALKALGRPVDSCDDFIVFMTVQKLDKQSRREWEASVGSKKTPSTFKDLQTFLENRICSIEALEGTTTKSQEPSTSPNKNASSNSSRNSKKSSSSSSQQGAKPHVSSNTSTSQKCALCQEGHFILFCDAFRNKSVEERRAFVLANKLCLNCLGHHYARDCRSQKTCQQCKGKHHTMLHDSHSTSRANATANDNQTNSEVPTAPSGSQVASHNVKIPRSSPRVLLATALINVSATKKNTFLARALIDQGSEATFISESLAQRMELSRSSASVIITGIGGTPATTSRGSVSLRIASRVNTRFSLQIHAYILSKLTKYQPPSVVPIARWEHLDGLSLADPEFSAHRPIDLILGADVFAQLILDGVRKGDANSPTAQSTQLGWILSGRTTSTTTSCSTVNSMQVLLDSSLSTYLQRFWEQEEIATTTPSLLPEEIICENHFLETHYRQEDGRYVVRLPIKKSLDNLGDSMLPASRMLQRMEHRFSQDTVFFDVYSAFMTEYEALNHMELVKSPRSNNQIHYYLPHHGVIRDSSTTTKLRVVFNGSQKTNSGYSLNDHLHVGQKLLPELVSILLRWRLHTVVFSADMEKMYRQMLHEDDRELQRIVWRNDPSSKINTYRLRTVTYGLTCAPFLAIRVIRQLAHDEKDRFPIGASSLLTDVYVDDVLSGAEDVPSALLKQNELIGLLKAGGFALRKWTSNAPELLNHLAKETTATTTTITWQPETFHMLGLRWQSSRDSFLFQLKTTELQQPITKRSVLSQIAQLFDPLGWLAPVTILAKVFMQSLWLLKLEWDEKLPLPEAQRWIRIYSDLPSIEKLHIPRWLGTNKNTQRLELHGFADASERAYAAVLYLRVTSDNGTSVTLVTAKTKVAPVKQVSLPRLELCAASLVTRLAKTTKEILELECPVHLWSDSLLTLPDAIWHHVDSRSNPADCASRGVFASELENHTLWWSGPNWLRQEVTCWPSQPRATSRDLPETKLTSHAAHHEKDEPFELLTRYSSLNKLLRITAWCCRVLKANQGQPDGMSTPSPFEIATSLRRLIRAEQQRNFKIEIRQLESKSTLSKSSILSLNPFLDEDGLLRVGGRLKNATLNSDEQHPYILPRDSPLSTLIIEQTHKDTLHGGVQLTLSTLRLRYWPIGGRTVVKSIINRCLTCVRFRATAATQLMGNLPTTRVNQSRPFLHSGLDYAGPIHLRTTKERGFKSYKAYIAVFVCFSTRAVHLEAVSDYTTDSFLAAFRRFVSRRGKCATLTSDCGTNFIGADAELRALFMTTSSESEKIARTLATDGTLWKFNPPAAPHFGGLWEAAVKSVKHHLRRVIGENKLTFEEISTLLYQIEACLNSRPLQALTDDPDDLTALTPAHFLIGEPLTAVPEPSLTNVPTSRLSRWQLLQQMQRHFWNRWSAEYLRHLQTRPKWQKEQPPLQVGDLVLIRNELLPPTKWPLARITKVHPGEDGHIRVATVKTATSSFTRPVVKLCPLLKGDEAQ